MADNFERFNRFDPYVTINRDIIAAQNDKTSDSDQPYSLIQWITSTSETFGTPDEYITNHIFYVQQWYKTKQNLRDVSSTRVVNDYVKFLKEVLIVHENQEEARFLMNVDWSSPYDLDIVVPYYANRLREIILYIVEQREKIRFEKTRNSHRGSTTGTTTYIYNQIIELLSSERYYLKYGKKLPDIQSTAADLTVTLNEKYDDSITSTMSSKDMYDYTSFIDYDQAVINILQDFPVQLAEDGEVLVENTTALSPTLSSDPDDVSVLPSRYFYNYINDKNTLNIKNHELWLKKYSGQEVHYLSAGDAGYNMGVLYEPDYKTYNHLNTFPPQVMYDMPHEGMKTLNQLGGFFKHTGITQAYSLNIDYEVVESNMKPGEVEYFVDPGVYGSSTDSIRQHEDTSYIKADASNDKLHGDIIDAEQYQKFYPYQSGDESNKYPKFGVSKNTDNFDFWKGDQKDVWANKDLYPVTLTYNYKQPTEDRVNDLLLGDRSVVSWRTDIFGNDYALLKPSIRPKIHDDPDIPPENPCRVLDAEYYWDDTTFERPPYTDNIDGGPTFRCYDLKLYTDYVYGGYFAPYHCTKYVCFEPNYVEYEDCPEPYVLSGHKVTNDPVILNYWLQNYVGKSGQNESGDADFEKIFNTWPRFGAGAYYDSDHVDWGTAGDGLPGGAGSWVYDPALNTAVQPQNTTFSAFVTPPANASNNYTHECVLQSTNGDDDHNGLVAAYIPIPPGDPLHSGVVGRTEYFALVLGRSCRGDTPNKGYGLMLIEPGITSVGTPIPVTTPGLTIPASVTESTTNWDIDPGRGGGWTGATTAVSVVRDGNMLHFRASEYGDTSKTKVADHTWSPDSIMSLDLTQDPMFAPLLQPTGYGFCNNSQADSFYLDASAFLSTPPQGFEFKIYDLTQCHPRQLGYDTNRMSWVQEENDEIEQHLATTGILFEDKDGCGSYGFDCMGRCLNYPGSADCMPKIPASICSDLGVWAADGYDGVIDKYYAQWHADGIDKNTVSSVSGLYLSEPDFDIVINRILADGVVPFNYNFGLGMAADPWPRHRRWDTMVHLPVGEYANSDDVVSYYESIQPEISDLPLMSFLNKDTAFKSPYAPAAGTTNTMVVPPGIKVELYERQDFDGEKAVIEGPVYLRMQQRSLWSGSPHLTNPVNSVPATVPGRGPLAVFLRQLKEYAKDTAAVQRIISDADPSGLSPVTIVYGQPLPSNINTVIEQYSSDFSGLGNSQANLVMHQQIRAYQLFTAAQKMPETLFDNVDFTTVLKDYQSVGTLPVSDEVFYTYKSMKIIDICVEPADLTPVASAGAPGITSGLAAPSGPLIPAGSVIGGSNVVVNNCIPTGQQAITCQGPNTTVTGSNGVVVQGMHAGAQLSVGTPAGGPPLHYELQYPAGTTIGILTIPHDPTVPLTTLGELRYSTNNECYSATFTLNNNRLILTRV